MGVEGVTAVTQVLEEGVVGTMAVVVVMIVVQKVAVNVGVMEVTGVTRVLAGGGSGSDYGYSS